MLPRLSVLIYALSLVSFAGCGVWKEEVNSESDSLLPPAQMSSDSVVLEIAFVHVPPDTESLVEKIWQELDEQHLPLEVRDNLAANGIRCGMAGVQLPKPLQELLAHQDNQQQVESEIGAPRVGETSGVKRLQCRTGLRHEIVTSPLRRQMTMMLNEDGKLRGQTCYQATCKIILRTFPKGDGQVAVEMTPEVHHGEPRPTYVGGENAFRIEMSQKKTVVDLIAMETTLSLGQTIVLGATAKTIGLGARFMTDESSGKPQPKLLLIRLAQTQYDDLFAQDQVLTSIAGPAE